MGVFGRNETSERCGEEAAVDEFKFFVPRDNRRLPQNGIMEKYEPQKTDTIVALKAKKLNDNVLRQVTSVAQRQKEVRIRCPRKVNNRKSDGALIGNMSKADISKLSDNKLKRNTFYQTPSLSQALPSSTQTHDCYDNNLKCQKLLNIYASKCTTIKVILFPEEEWARNAPMVQWSLKLNKWWKKFCTITEKSGSKTATTYGKITQNQDGTVYITGKFKREGDCDFRLHLSGRLRHQDIQNGYVMIGSLQQGSVKSIEGMQVTHFATIARHQ